MSKPGSLWDNAAERSVLGAVLFDERCLADVAAILEPADFRFAPHGVIFAAAQRLRVADTPIDVVTLGDAVRSDGHTALVGEIAAEGFSSASAAAWARIVRDYAQRRAVITLCRSAISDATDNKPIADVIADVGARLEATGTRVIGADTSWDAAVRRTMLALEQAANRGDDEIPGIRTNIGIIDNGLGGLCAGRLVILAARPGAGKTALSNQVAFTAAHNGTPVGFVSLEMSEAELVQRAWAMRYSASFTRLQKGRGDALAAVTAGCRDEGLEGVPIWLDEDAFDLAEIEARVTGWVRAHAVKAVIVDHLQLVDVPGRLSPNERIGIVTKRLKRLAKRLGIAILLLCQLNRNGEREGRRPTMADLRDSGSIEQDADAILALHVDAEDVSSEPRPVWPGLLKNRTGRTGWPDQPMTFEGRFQRFSEPDAEDWR